MKRKTLILASIVIAILLSCSCSQKQNDSVIYNTIGKQIDICHNINDTAAFTVFRYIENPTCTSCQLKLGEWKVYGRRLHRKFGEEVNIRFLCKTKRIDEAKHLFKMYGFDKNAAVDSMIDFFEINDLDKCLGKDVVFLLDSDNTILSIGNPNENVKVEALYDSIISGKFRGAYKYRGIARFK